MTVTQLVEDCRNGRTEAWTSLVQLIRPKAVNWAHQFLRDGDSAEDVVQDSLLLAARHLNELRNVQAFESWFFQIVKTQAFRSVLTHEFVLEGPDGPSLLSAEYKEWDLLLLERGAPCLEDGTSVRVGQMGTPMAASRARSCG